MDKNILKTIELLHIGKSEKISKFIESIILDSHSTSNIFTAQDIYNKNNIDIIVCDIEYIDLLKNIRRDNKNIHIIMLSEDIDPDLLIDVIKLRVSDFIKMPTSNENIKQSIYNIIEEILDTKGTVNISNGIEYNYNNKTIFAFGNVYKLTTKEQALIELLIENKDKTVESWKIKDYLWGDSDNTSDASLKSLLNRVRKKVGKDTIKNISGLGYCL